MKANENIHAGHRERLRKSIEQIGVINVSELNYLEHVLTYVIHRSDTNPVAHALLNEFKSFHGVLDAPERALQTVPGVGPKVARFLKDLLNTNYVYTRSKAIHSTEALNTINKVARFIKDISPISRNEEIIILILNKSLEPKNYKIYSGYSDTEVLFDSVAIKDFLLKNDAKYCVVAHTHPSGSCTPSQLDNLVQENTINPLMKSLSIVIMDALILCEHKFFSYRYNNEFSYVENETSNIYKINAKNYNSN